MGERISGVRFGILGFGGLGIWIQVGGVGYGMQGVCFRVWRWRFRV